MWALVETQLEFARAHDALQKGTDETFATKAMADPCNKFSDLPANSFHGISVRYGHIAIHRRDARTLPCDARLLLLLALAR